MSVLSLVVGSRSHSLLWSWDFSLQGLLLWQSTGSRCTGFSSCGTEPRKLWLTGLVVPMQVESSPTRD